MLSIKNLSISIKNKILLEDINFEVKEGEVFGIIGESGSGKSLLSSAITKLYPKNSQIKGNIIFENKNILSLNKREIENIRGKKISMIFQEPMTALNPLLTIRKQIIEPLQIHTKKSKKEIYHLTEKKLFQVGLNSKNNLSDLYPHQLSGGQRQRAMIALATILKPKILIADEPTSSLDVYNQSKIIKLLKKLSVEDKITIIFITHDLTLLSHMVKNLIILKDKKIFEKGNINEIFSDKKNNYIKNLLEESNLDKLNIEQNPKKIELLKVSNLTKTYNEKILFFTKSKLSPAIQKLNFTINKGECLGIVGPSGCGKSTLAKVILGLINTDQGEIILNKNEINMKEKFKKDVRKKIQIVFQDPYSSFNPRHKIRKIISEPFFLHKSKYSKKELDILLKKLIEAVGMQISDLEKFPHQFSGGQRQRIAIARALSTNPELIVLDEALSALDIIIKKKILILLKSLSKKYDLSYLFITHDLNLVKVIANKIIVMNKGKIVETGDTTEVLKNPKKNFTQKLIDCSIQLPKEWIQE